MSPTATSITTPPTGRGLNVGLWIAQAVIAASFCPAGAMKLVMPIGRLSAIWPWTAAVPAPFVRTLGVIDIVGGIGLVLPMLVGMRRGWTVLAALGCVALQGCALGFHASRGEFSQVPVNVVFAAICGFILWGRRRRTASR